MINVWEVIGNTDSIYFTKQADAQKAKGRGSVKQGFVYESFAEFEAKGRENLREAALNKLTEEERDILGLTNQRSHMVSLTYRNNWGFHEYYAGGNLDHRTLKAIQYIYVDGVPYNTRAQQVTAPYTDHGVPATATSIQLEILVAAEWRPIQEFMDQTRPNKIQIIDIIFASPRSLHDQAFN